MADARADLIARLEAAEAPTRDLMDDAFSALGIDRREWPRYDTLAKARAWESVAALLAERAVPWCPWQGARYADGGAEFWVRPATYGAAAWAQARHPALALVAAVLRAGR